jgi:hypothetical protein
VNSRELIDRLTEERLVGGSGDGRSLEGFDQDEVALGRTVEREHAVDPAVIDEIVADHLTDNPGYYSALLKAGLVDENLDDRLERGLEELTPEIDRIQADRLLTKVANQHSESYAQEIADAIASFMDGSLDDATDLDRACELDANAHGLVNLVYIFFPETPENPAFERALQREARRRLEAELR